MRCAGGVFWGSFPCEVRACSELYKKGPAGKIFLRSETRFRERSECVWRAGLQQGSVCAPSSRTRTSSSGPAGLRVVEESLDEVRWRRVFWVLSV